VIVRMRTQVADGALSIRRARRTRFVLAHLIDDDTARDNPADSSADSSSTSRLNRAANTSSNWNCILPTRVEVGDWIPAYVVVGREKFLLLTLSGRSRRTFQLWGHNL
jgi:hypothetical protein